MQTVGASLIGVSISCARCLNLKSDPLSIQDYNSMTAAFQDIEFGSRFPEFSKDHPRKEKSREIWKNVSRNRYQIRAQRSTWEEDWGAYKELHWKPIMVKALRVYFKSGYAAVDELEIFGKPREALN